MKANKATVLLRVEGLLRIRLDGAEFWDVREFVRGKEKEKGSAWELPEGDKPLSDPTLWRYIARTDKLIAESCRSSRKKLLRNHQAVRRNLFAKAVAAGDYKTALACKRDEAELLGLYPPKKVAPTTPDGEHEYQPGGFSDPEVLGILQGLAARLGFADAGPAAAEPTDAAG